MAWILNMLNRKNRTTLIKVFIESQLFYCPLMCIFYGRNMNYRMNHLHKRTLRINYNDYGSTFSNFLNLYILDLFTVGTFVCWKTNYVKWKIITSELFDLWNIKSKPFSQTDFSLGTLYTTYLWVKVYRITCFKKYSSKGYQPIIFYILHWK